MSQSNSSNSAAFTEDIFGSQAELDALSERGGHDEATVLTLFRRLREARTGNRNAVRGGNPSSLRDHLVMVHAPLVEHCARNFKASGEPLDDLVQEGYVGLIKAVDRFDPEKNIKFSTYACHLIVGEIRHYLRDLGRIIHEPGWHFELRQRIAKTADSLIQQTGQQPTPEQIASHLNVKVETVREVLERVQTLRVESLDEPAGDDGNDATDLLERFDARRSSHGHGSHGHAGEGRIEDSMFLEDALPQLKALEQQALTMFFFDELSKSEIARRLGISVNYSAYLIRRGTESLRRILETTEPIPGVQLAASAWAQQQVRATYLLELAKNAGQGNERRSFRPPHKIAAASKNSIASLTQFSGWLDDEVARVGRYGGEFSLCWLQIRNWFSLTKNISDSEKRTAAASAAVLVRRLCRGLDKVSALQSHDPPGLHFLVMMPSTGNAGKIVEERLLEGFLRPDLPGITAALHVRSAFAICPKDARFSEELFEFMGEQLRLEDA